MRKVPVFQQKGQLVWWIRTPSQAHDENIGRILGKGGQKIKDTRSSDQKTHGNN